jgi:hypothetical protein
MTDEEFLASLEEGVRQERTNLFLRSARRLYELAGDAESVAYADERIAAEPRPEMILVQFSAPVMAELVRRARRRGRGG